MDLAVRLANHESALSSLVRALQAGGDRPTAAHQQHERTAKLSDEESQKMVSEYLDGATIAILSERYGVHHQTVTRHIKRAGHETRRADQRHISVDFSAAVRMYEEGLSTADIAERLGVGRETVRRRLHAAGVTLRQRGGNRGSH